jgi:predicted GIY-YIG superfamily endonuclease
VSSVALAKEGKNMHYVYLIQSQKDKTFYTGITKDLIIRIKEHNRKRSRFTSTKIPYRLIWYCGFYDKTKAYAFEKYLKTGSGIAFYRKHLINL